VVLDSLPPTLTDRRFDAHPKRRPASGGVTGVMPALLGRTNTIVITADTTNVNLIELSGRDYASPNSTGTLNFTPSPALMRGQSQ